MWDFSSLTGDQTRVPCIARQILNRWTNREVPQCHSHKPYFYLFCSCSLRPSESKLTGPGYQSADPRLGPYILKGHHLYYYSEGISRQAWTEIGAAGKRCRFPGNRVSCGSGASGWATFLVTVLEVVTVKSWESHTCVFRHSAHARCIEHICVQALLCRMRWDAQMSRTWYGRSGPKEGSARRGERVWPCAGAVMRGLGRKRSNFN